MGHEGSEVQLIGRNYLYCGEKAGDAKSPLEPVRFFALEPSLDAMNIDWWLPSRFT